MHEGSSASGTGCYTTPVYHKHVNACYKTQECPGTFQSISGSGNNWTGINCSYCGISIYNKVSIANLAGVLSCGKSNNTIVGYSAGCGKTESTIETAEIVFNK